MPIAYSLSPKTNQHNSKNIPSSAKVRYPFAGGKGINKIGAHKENVQKDGARSGVRKVPLKDNIELTDRQTVILSVFRDNVSLAVPLNTTILSQKLKVARKTMQRELGELQKIGAVSRLGGRKFGYWIVNEDWK